MNLAISLCLLLGAASAVPTALQPNQLRSDVNLTEIVRQYASFGAEDGQYDSYNCTAWARLWNEDGIRNTPGVPPSKGWAALETMCESVRSQFSVLFCDIETEIDVMSYNTEKRTAFKWTINGILIKTQSQVQIPAISALFMDPDGTIQNAWDWLDPTPLGLTNQTDSELSVESELTAPNVTEIARIYMNFGGFPNYPAASNCTLWTNQFDSIMGTRNTPGVPPSRGYDQLYKACRNARDQFTTMLNYAELIIPVISWNAQRRVALLWGLEGLTTDGRIIQRQVISALFMYQNGTIQTSWDWLDPQGI